MLRASQYMPKRGDLYIDDDEVLENVLKRRPSTVSVYFCVVTVNDDITKPRFKRKLRG